MSATVRKAVIRSQAPLTRTVPEELTADIFLSFASKGPRSNYRRLTLGCAQAWGGSI